MKMVMVEVFKTNVHKHKDATRLTTVLNGSFPSFKINFDLDDRDKVLRIEGREISTEKIISILNAENFQCETIE